MRGFFFPCSLSLSFEFTVAVVNERFIYVKFDQSYLAVIYLSISRNLYVANSYRLGVYSRQECCVLALFLYFRHQLLVSAGDKFLSFDLTAQAHRLFLCLWMDFFL